MSRWMSRVVPAIAVSSLWVVTAMAGPIIGLNFNGASLSNGFALNGYNYGPPDTMGAVGPNHIVEFINGVYATYDKTTGSLIGSMITDTQFWVNAGLPSSGLSDPRILYDPGTSRWFACQITTSQLTGNNIYIARSNTSDPTAGWSGVSLPVTNGRFADYPTLGLNADGVYIGTNDFTAGISTGTLTNESVYSIPKADLLGAPSLANLTRFDALSPSTVGFTIQAAVDYGPSTGHAALVAVDFDLFARIDRTNLLGTTGPGATMSPTTTISVAPTSFPPQATQPDGTAQIDTLDDRFSANVYYQVGDLLYMAHDISTLGRAAIRWTILDELSNVVIQEGTLSDPNYDLFQPSIAANAYGDVVIGFNRSGLTENISAYAVVGATAGGVLTFGAPMLLQAGLAGDYHLFGGSYERWGDYSATMVDPSDPYSFWTFQEYPVSNDIWGTQITQIILEQRPTSQVPEPASLALVALGGLALLRRRRRAAA